MSELSKEELRNIIQGKEQSIANLRRKLSDEESSLYKLNQKYNDKYGSFHYCPMCNKQSEYSHEESYNHLLICSDCDKKSVNQNGLKPIYDSDSDSGDNPIYIDDIKCWRRYKFGGFITLIDKHDCQDETEFYARNF